LNIYFAASIRGGGIDQETCRALVKHLKRYGVVFTEHICREAGGRDDRVSDEEIYERDIRWLRASDAVVAEVSVPSLGVGYEIGKAEDWGKRVLCLYRKGSSNRLSAMIGGNKCIVVKGYREIDEALSLIDGFLNNSRL
jgi:nucleoside 2-deoxyribosyltransferase